MPPRIVTVPREEDVDRMRGDVARAKESADAVVLSLHWGLHYVPRMIAEYQPIVANAAFDAGVDLILGHHPHVPKAIEARRDGKVCFYSLGNFMFTTNTGLKAGFADKMRKYGIDDDFDEYPHCPHGADSKRSLIAKAVFSTNGLERASFLPVHMDKQLRPEVLATDDPRFNENTRFMDWVSAGFDHFFEVEGEEVVIGT
jgi:poly-gamma-glutamate synthesis protein (capsule biosynthesis protein)